ncbi:MAG: hypothetical protein GWO20_15955 [Candidatus Korarchaeota archaeon]|nr:hypothetical protein [Candidatus Korarchaeota archaeon]NIU84884.1 hypothetical protein [Candidatus Thorarchaeota archaeon]NIW14910.1 hypothetical protein [Candidatus Thorarchaeota archaeon]NIW52944.1 hypothetical protein [Candidatus Korarchaeota archaeon]
MPLSEEESSKKSELAQLKTEIIERLSTLITTAFGLVAALAWNEAIKAIFAEVFGSPTELVPMLIYAITVTIIAVVATIWIGRTAKKLK